MDIVRAMHPEIYKEDLPVIHPRNRTEEDTVNMRMDPELYKAAKKGDSEKLILLIRLEKEDSNEFFLRRTQSGNNNILHIAARAGCPAFVAKALNLLPVLSDQVNSQGDSPLLVAARFGHLEVVETIVAARTKSSQRDAEEGLDRQLDVLLKNSVQGTTALHEALRNRHEDVACYLLRLKPEMATFHSRAGESPLFLAAESHCQKFVKQILRSRQPYSSRGPYGQNALHAARNCDGEIISELIQENPDLMRQLDSHGKAAIHYAVEAEYWGLLRQMLKADASISLFPDADGYTPLLRAASEGYLKICQVIIEKCPESVEARNDKGQNALHLFKLRKKGDGEELFKIAEIQDLLNIGDDDGNAPLHLAIKEHHYDKAIFFIGTNDIDLGAVNKKGLTALDLCKSEWNPLNTQGFIYMLLRRRGAPRGRRPNYQEVPVGGRELKPFLETMTLIATLISTVTFAAAFTMPGGFDTRPGNLGVAILVKKASLKTFILADSIAMCCSMAVMFLLLWAMITEKDADVNELAIISSQVLQFALLATLVAFVSGIFAVIAPMALWVPILVCIFCGIVAFISARSNLLLARIIVWLYKVPALVFLLILRRKPGKKGKCFIFNHEDKEVSSYASTKMRVSYFRRRWEQMFPPNQSQRSV